MSLTACTIASGIAAALIASFASVTAIPICCFCTFFSDVVRFSSALILLFTMLASLTITCLALVFWVFKSLPGSYTVLILTLLFSTASLISLRVRAALIASFASVTARSMSCFCLFFFEVVRFWSVSLLLLTILASLAILPFAIAFCAFRSLPGT